MVSLEVIVIICSLLVLCASIIYYGQAIREQNSVRLAQLRLDQIRFINDDNVDKALTEILWVWNWDDFDDYWLKYSPKVNPDANVMRRVARNYYVALATMIRKNDLDIELLYELNPSGITRYWEKMAPIAYEFRMRNDYPDYLEPVEYLAERIAKLRNSRSLPPPRQV